MIESFVQGMLWGAVAALVSLVAIFGLTGRLDEHHRILERTPNGAVCHVDRFYPRASCAQLFHDLGPRLNTVAVKR